MSWLCRATLPCSVLSVASLCCCYSLCPRDPSGEGKGACVCANVGEHAICAAEGKCAWLERRVRVRVRCPWLQVQ